MRIQPTITTMQNNLNKGSIIELLARNIRALRDLGTAIYLLFVRFRDGSTVSNIIPYYLYCVTLFLGSYSDSSGVEIIRRHIANYITERDGVQANYEDVFLCTGASDGIKVFIQFKIHCKLL